MIKTEQRELGSRGYTYVVEQLGARAGSRLLVRLGKMLGKPLGDALSKSMRLDAASIGAGVSALSELLNEADFDYVCDQFMAKTRITGGEYGAKQPKLDSAFDLHFAGQYGELLEWLAFCVEVNYASFFADAGRFLPPAPSPQGSEQKGEASASPSPSTSEKDGPSGG